MGVVRRILRAYGRRVADGGVEALSLMTGLPDELDATTAQAIQGLRGRATRGPKIGTRLGITCRPRSDAGGNTSSLSVIHYLRRRPQGQIIAWNHGELISSNPSL